VGVLGRKPLNVTGNIFLDGQLYRFVDFTELTYDQTLVFAPGLNKYRKRRKNAVKPHEKVKLVQRTVRRSIWESECPMCLKPFTIEVPVNWPFHSQTPVRYCSAHRNLTQGENARVHIETTIVRLLDQSLLVSLDQMAKALGVSRVDYALLETLKKLKKAKLAFWHGHSYTKVPYKEEVARKIMCHEIGRRGRMTMADLYEWFAAPSTLKEAKLAVWFDAESDIKLNSVRLFVNKMRVWGFIKRDKHTYSLPFDYAMRDIDDDALRIRLAAESRAE
jgi:hypothetical protein